ncbi:hypothetical protein CPB83DRAFT_594384 [Crepidotus variabilis]|uniref:Uncharacterized protein n=1 Tax=Crepidotus variabilis TaxID=179855 RepID=A0A9P6JL19_9AGAR|nr:hypothetical protein CPB83DRAFT_594384 [Crepidotus variabilis]
MPFSVDDTIRATSPKSNAYRTGNQPSPVPCRHRDGTRSRSPIKGLFTSRSSLAESSTAVQFTVLEADITDASDDSGVEDDAVYISHFSVASRNARLRSSGPPGLTPPYPTSISPSPTPKSKNRSFNFMFAKDFSGTLKTNPSSPISNVQDESCTVVPLPHRNAPSPPSQPPCVAVSIPSVTISAPSAGLDAPTVRASSSRTPATSATIAPSTIKSKHNQPRFTARTRLHSLLKDVRHGRISSSIPSSPVPRPSRTSLHPPPLELSGSPESRDLTDLDLFTEDDDETPRPSPIAEHYCKIPTVPMVRSFNL